MKLICDCFDLNHLENYVQSGVDRLIVALPHVSVRQVKTFSFESIAAWIPVVHEKHIEVAVNMLSFMMEEEIELFQDALTFCKENHVDFIYYSDMGVFQLASEMGMEERLIYQPTTLITNSMDAQNYLDLGIHSVVLSREITLEDTLRILQKTSNCEVIVFGRNAMMHSKRKLLSSYFEFCGLEDKSNSRNLYLMEENRDEKMPIYQDEKGTFVFSGSVFCMFSALSQLVGADLRIDGTSLTEEMVCQTCHDIHLILEGEDGKKMFEKYQLDHPEFLFSEGFMYKKTSLVKEGCE